MWKRIARRHSYLVVKDNIDLISVFCQLRDDQFYRFVPILPGYLAVNIETDDGLRFIVPVEIVGHVNLTKRLWVVNQSFASPSYLNITSISIEKELRFNLNS